MFFFCDISITYHSKAMANVKVFEDKQMDRWMFLEEELVGSNCSLFNATPKFNFLTPLIPNPNHIPTKWMECNPIKTNCTLTLTSQCRACTCGPTDRQTGRPNTICSRSIDVGGIKKTPTTTDTYQHSQDENLCWIVCQHIRIKQYIVFIGNRRSPTPTLRHGFTVVHLLGPWGGHGTAPCFVQGWSRRQNGPRIWFTVHASPHF